MFQKISQAFQYLFGFIKSVFSEDGQGSYSRCAGGFVVVAVVSWVSYVVWKTKVIPDLQGPAFFLASGNAVSYGTNKLPDILSAIRGNKTP